MRKLALALFALIFGVSASFAQSTFNAIVTQASAAIAISSATTTKLITGVTGKYVYITALNVIAAGTGNIQFVYGTGTNCGTGTTNLTGNYNLTAQAGLAQGSGVGPIIVVPAGVDVCATTSAAVGMAGVIGYAQF